VIQPRDKKELASIGVQNPPRAGSDLCGKGQGEEKRSMWATRCKWPRRCAKRPWRGRAHAQFPRGIVTHPAYTKGRSRSGCRWNVGAKAQRVGLKSHRGGSRTALISRRKAWLRRRPRPGTHWSKRGPPGKKDGYEFTTADCSDSRRGAHRPLSAGKTNTQCVAWRRRPAASRAIAFSLAPMVTIARCEIFVWAKTSGTAPWSSRASYRLAKPAAKQQTPAFQKHA